MVHIYTPVIAPRTLYALRVIFRDHLQIPYRVSSDTVAWRRAEGPKINYSTENLPDALRITPSGILEETYVRGGTPAADPLQNVPLHPLWEATEGSFSDWEDARRGPHAGEGSRDWPFDLPGAVFDPMDRFDYTSSWAYRQGCLDRPLVDEWIEAFREQWLQPALEAAGGSEMTTGEAAEAGASLGTGATVTAAMGGSEKAGEPEHSFIFSPTYDIDLAWCYRHKGIFRTLLSLAHSILRGNIKQLVERWKVWTYKLPDPFNNYDWMDELHEAHPVDPIYFFPAGRALNAYDKNHSPRNKAYKALIRRHAARYPVGIHPSFYSDGRGRLKKEKSRLSAITGKPVTLSRFHFIRFRLPGSYRLLLENGITTDYSMGYGHINGFRASYSRPFPWYDLEKERETSLQVVPFCFMEATSYYEQQQTPQATKAELERYIYALRAVNGRLTTIWHNSSLNDSPHWIGWRSIYHDLFHKVHPPTRSI